MIGREFDIHLDVYKQQATSYIHGTETVLPAWFIAGDRQENFLYITIKKNNEIVDISSYTPKILYEFANNDSPISQLADIISNKIKVAVEPRALLHGNINKATVQLEKDLTDDDDTLDDLDSKLTILSFTIRVIENVTTDIDENGNIIEHHYENLDKDYISAKIEEHNASNNPHSNMNWGNGGSILEDGTINRINGLISSIQTAGKTISFIRDNLNRIASIEKEDITIILNRENNKIISWEVEST